MNSPNLSASPLDETTTEPAVCETHGKFERKVYPPPIEGMDPFRTRCPACVAEVKAKNEARERRHREAERELEVSRLIRNADIPARFREKTIDEYAARNPGQKLAVNVFRKYVEDFPAHAEVGRSLVLTGQPGTGKTHLACAALSDVIRRYAASGRFDTVSDLLRSIKETYRKDSQVSERDVISEYVYCDLLVVDELGVQVGSEHEKLLLFEVLNGRYQELRPTILISNLSAGELEDFLGHRVMDRYRECGVVLAFDWESHRGSKAA